METVEVAGKVHRFVMLNDIDKTSSQMFPIGPGKPTTSVTLSFSDDGSLTLFATVSNILAVEQKYRKNYNRHLKYDISKLKFIVEKEHTSAASNAPPSYALKKDGTYISFSATPEQFSKIRQILAFDNAKPSDASKSAAPKAPTGNMRAASPQVPAKSTPISTSYSSVQNSRSYQATPPLPHPPTKSTPASAENVNLRDRVEQQLSAPRNTSRPAQSKLPSAAPTPVKLEEPPSKLGDQGRIAKLPIQSKSAAPSPLSPSKALVPSIIVVPSTAPIKRGYFHPSPLSSLITYSSGKHESKPPSSPYDDDFRSPGADENKENNAPKSSFSIFNPWSSTASGYGAIKPSETVKYGGATVKLEGIRNIGNSCYMNSMLQALLNLSGLQHDFNSTVWRSIRKAKANEAVELRRQNPYRFNDTSCTLAFADLIHTKQHKTELPMDPSKFKRSMDTLTKAFVGYIQHDAHEFLIAVLDSLHDEMKAWLVQSYKQLDKSGDEAGSAKKRQRLDPSVALETGADTDGEDSPRRNPTETTTLDQAEQAEMEAIIPTARQFHSELDITFTCSACNYSRVKREVYRDFSIMIDSDGSDQMADLDLHNLLNLFFTPEMREYSCEKCAEGKTARVSTTFARLPNVFIVHLKRFSYNETYTGLRKSHRAVKFPLELDLAQLCAAPSTASTAAAVESKKSEEALSPSVPSTLSKSLSLVRFPSDVQTGVSEFLHGVTSKFKNGFNKSILGMFTQNKKRKVHSELSNGTGSGTVDSSPAPVEETEDSANDADKNIDETTERKCSKCNLKFSGIASDCCALCKGDDDDIAMETEEGPGEELAPLEYTSSTYKLNSVVRHWGSDAQSGHYICDIRTAGHAWSRCDDSKVYDIEEDRVFAENTDAYVLFYTRSN